MRFAASSDNAAQSPASDSKSKHYITFHHAYTKRPRADVLRVKNNFVRIHRHRKAASRRLIAGILLRAKEGGADEPRQTVGRRGPAISLG
jgi:hypothetical protein